MYDDNTNSNQDFLLLPFKCFNIPERRITVLTMYTINTAIVKLRRVTFSFSIIKKINTRTKYEKNFIPNNDVNNMLKFRFDVLLVAIL